MKRRLIVSLAGFAVVSALAQPVSAQNVQGTLFGSIGAANVYRADDQSFGTGTNVGGGGGIQWKKLGVEAEVHGVMGLTPRDVQCAVVNVPCTGTARSGVLSATMVSGNVSYQFGTGRVSPYLIGSVGALFSEMVDSVTTVSGGVATLSEVTEQDTGLALGIGFGVDVALTPSLSLRPEFRTYTATAMSGSNLGLHRGSVGLRYRW